MVASIPVSVGRELTQAAAKSNEGSSKVVITDVKDPESRWKSRRHRRVVVTKVAVTQSRRRRAAPQVEVNKEIVESGTKKYS